MCRVAPFSAVELFGACQIFNRPPEYLYMGKFGGEQEVFGELGPGNLFPDGFGCVGSGFVTAQRGAGRESFDGWVKGSTDCWPQRAVGCVRRWVCRVYRVTGSVFRVLDMKVCWVYGLGGYRRSYVRRIYRVTGSVSCWMYRIAGCIGLLAVEGCWVYKTWVFRAAELGWLDLYVCWI